MVYLLNVDLDSAKNTSMNLPIAASYLFHALQDHRIVDRWYLPIDQLLQVVIRPFRLVDIFQLQASITGN